MQMTDIERAKQLFRESGLAFPAIPEELAAQLKEQGKWLFATREIFAWPYNLHQYVREVDETHVDDYALLAHSGYGVNSYALQYYVVYGALRMFLFLGWGGVYMDAKADATKIRDCFSLADEIIPAVQTVARLQAGDLITIVASDFYGSYWSAQGKSRRGEDWYHRKPAEVLAEALQWLRSYR
ncbi:MAG: hypothetical protein QME78_08360 [Thermodesulfobacteriota bacterium]|nr:hypothetical protein [Thermodesulfobacteriota bacterium]